MVPLWSPGDAIVVSGATVPKGATLDARGIAVVVKGCRLLHCRDRTTLMCTGVMVGTTKLPGRTKCFYTLALLCMCLWCADTFSIEFRDFLLSPLSSAASSFFSCEMSHVMPNQTAIRVLPFYF